MIDTAIASKPILSSAELSQSADLHDVVEAKWQHRSACSCGTDRSKAARLVGSVLAREQPAPAAGAHDEAQEVTARRQQDEP
jgi:hypothetical protein